MLQDNKSACRNIEHQYNYAGSPNKLQNFQEKSILFNHQKNKNWGPPANFKMSVLKSYSDSLSRQAGKVVYISKMQGEILYCRSEFYQPSTVIVSVVK